MKQEQVPKSDISQLKEYRQSYVEMLKVAEMREIARNGIAACDLMKEYAVALNGGKRLKAARLMRQITKKLDVNERLLQEKVGGQLWL